jgi:hypothetical protein
MILLTPLLRDIFLLSTVEVDILFPTVHPQLQALENSSLAMVQMTQYLLIFNPNPDGWGHT